MTASWAQQDSDGNTALHYAALFRLDSSLNPLLERRARPDVGNSSGECAVHWAAKSSNVIALDAMTRASRAFLSMRDCDGFTVFVVSAEMDNCPVMELNRHVGKPYLQPRGSELCRRTYLKGVSLEEQDDYGRTALQWACYEGNKKTTACLKAHPSMKSMAP
ncbi:Ankrd24 [Symbiodinium sp. CCMP2592]|nr:Ankrd24 [Symbiodinium sp. CCMP2592]